MSASFLNEIDANYEPINSLLKKAQIKAFCLSLELNILS